MRRALQRTRMKVGQLALDVAANEDLLATLLALTDRESVDWIDASALAGLGTPNAEMREHSVAAAQEGERSD